MKKKLAIICSVLLIIAFITLPVSAAPASKSPMMPIRYEYYTAPMMDFQSYHDPLYDQYDETSVTNSGNSAADVCWYKYLRYGQTDFYLAASSCISLPAGKTERCIPLIHTNSTMRYKMKITTNSSYVIPNAVLIGGTIAEGFNIIDLYHPGDFQKVEIYS